VDVPARQVALTRPPPDGDQSSNHLFNEETTMTRRSRRSFAALTIAAMALVSSQCRAAPGPHPDVEHMSLSVDGQERTYLIERPNAPGPQPTVIMLHGRGGNAAEMAKGTGLAQLAQQENFVAVFANGMAHQWNVFPPGTAPQGFMEQGRAGGGIGDDVAFIKTLVGDLIQHGISDPKRIYLAGFSNGGEMTLRMACVAPELFAAVATISNSMSEPVGQDCARVRPLPIVMMHGTADKTSPYAGGDSRRHEFTFWGVERTIAFFRKLDGCADRSTQTPLPAPEQQASGATLTLWSQCAGGAVELVRIEGGVHRVPDAAFTAPTLWSFLRDKSRGSGMVEAAPAARAAPIRQPPAVAFAQSQVQSPPPAAAGPAAVAPSATAPSAAAPSAAAPSATAPSEEEVTFQSNGYALAGCIVRPAGPGPFPAVIYNHGSEKNPRRCGPPELARAYVEHGYAFFAFQRHGHGQSPGDYIVDLEKQGGGAQRSVALHEAYNRDVVGAVEWLMRRPEIDRRRVVMTGISYGGIQTVLTAEKGLGIRAFLPFAPGAMSWANPALQKRLEQAVRNAKAPLFLAQAQNDFSLGPSQILGPIIRAKGAPNFAKIYPPSGTTHEQGHGGFAVRAGIPVWSPDVFAFLDKTMPGTEASH
jgi:poly(3-hydroxybutyrate) depolymerase